MARVALALVELGHERDRHALLVGDLLGAVLVDRVLVRGLEHGAVGEVDLVLAEVALALGVLDPQPGAGHAVADPADQRLDARGAEHRVVDVVEVRRGEVAVAERRRLVVGVAEDDELELGRADGGQPALGEPVELRAQDLARRGDDRARRRPSAGRPGTARCPRATGRSRSVSKSGLHLEVAVAALPRRHRVAVDGVHLDVDGEQVVAGLGAVARRPRRGSGGRSSRLPCSRPCMSVRHEQDGVDARRRRPPRAARRARVGPWARTVPAQRCRCANHHARGRLDGRRRSVVGSVRSRPMRARGGAMAASEPGLGTRILGDRWAVADGTPKPAWVQIEEQLADRIEAGRARARRAAAAGARPRAGARREPDDRAPGARLARRPRAGRARRRPRHVRARGARRSTHDLTRVAGFTERGRAPGPRGGRADPRGRASCAAPDARRATRSGLDAGAPVAADRARPARRRPADDAGGHLAARRALPRPARARPRRLALRADARALRPRAGRARRSGSSRSPRARTRPRRSASPRARR